MSQVCKITKKKPLVGHKVSHANKKSKRRFNVNLQTHRFWIPSQKRFIKLRVSTQGIRIIDKLGIEKVLEQIKKYQKEIAE
jgi:large subunit ribosomal protein L28